MGDVKVTKATHVSLRQQGNDAFAQQKFSRAVELYTSALAAAHSSTNDRHVLLGNRAAANLKLGLHAVALSDATEATAIQPTWSKGWYRKAAALEALGCYAEAEAASQQGNDLGGSKDLAAQLAHLRGLRLETTNGSDGKPTAEHCNTATDGANSTERAAAAAKRAVQPGARLEATRPGGCLSSNAVAELLPSELRSGHRFQHSQDGGDSNLLLLFHGLGDRPDAFATLAQHMQLPQTAALALAGPSTVPFTEGGRAWFHSFDQEGNFVTGRSAGAAAARRDASLAATLKILQSAVNRLSDKTKGGWPRCRIHLFGFSQGGTVALHLAAANRGCRKLGSCAAVSAAMIFTSWGTLPPSLLHTLSATASSGSSSKATPVMITHGDADAVLPRDDVIATCSFLNASCPGSAEYVPFSKGHSMISGPKEMRTLMSFWAEHLGVRPIADNDNEEIVDLSA